MPDTTTQSPGLFASLAAIILPLTAVMLDGIPLPVPSGPAPIVAWTDTAAATAFTGGANGEHRLGRAGPASGWLIAAQAGESLPLE